MTQRTVVMGQAGIAALSLAVLAACQGGPGLGAAGPGGSGGGGAGMATTCLKGAAVGAVGGLVYDALTGKKTTDSSRRRLESAGRGALAGCVVNLAVTAVGQMLQEGQRSRYEDALQRDARRRALEQEKYGQARARVQARPAATPQQVAARDAELARLQAEYEASMAKPVVADLGGGATATIEGQPPVTAGEFAGCQTKTMLVSTPGGQARQQEMFCPNERGDLVRVDARPA